MKPKKRKQPMEDAACTMVCLCRNHICWFWTNLHCKDITFFKVHCEHWANICIFQLRGYWMTSYMKMVFHNLHFSWFDTQSNFMCSILVRKSNNYHFNFTQNSKHSWDDMEGLLSDLFFFHEKNFVTCHCEFRFHRK